MNQIFKVVCLYRKWEVDGEILYFLQDHGTVL